LIPSSVLFEAEPDADTWVARRGVGIFFLFL